MMHRFYVAVIVFMTISLGLLANTIVPITDIGTSGKTLGLGGIEGLSQQASVLFENPATMQGIDSREYSFMYTVLSDEETKYINWATVFPWRDYRIGVGFVQLAIPDLDFTGRTDGNEYFVQDTFSIRDRVYKVGISQSITEYLDVGISGTYLTQDFFVLTGSGINVDVGASLRYYDHQHSFTIKNALPFFKVRYNNNGTPHQFPFRVVWASSYTFLESISVLGQLTYHSKPRQILTAYGLEWAPLRLERSLILFAGWKNIVVANHIKHRITTGVELNLSKMSIQFAYEHTEYTLNHSRYSVSLNLAL